MALAIGLEECGICFGGGGVSCVSYMNGVRPFLDTHSLINRGYLGNQTIIHAHGKIGVRSVFFLNCVGLDQAESRP
jgi:hypothetical protein